MAVTLITGCSSGIGLATALHFARQGHEVFAGVRDPSAAADLVAAIQRDGLGIRVVSLDVDDPASVQRGIGDVYDAAGRIDVLVNNAGIGGGGAIEDVPLDWAQSLFQTDYFGAVRTTQTVLPGMRRQRSGVIVNVSSIAGRVAIAGHGHYSAVKHALEAMSEALAQEVQSFGIRVAIVEPGVVVTPIFGKARRFGGESSPYADHVRRLLLFYRNQMPRASRPEDAAAVIYEAASTPEPRLRWTVGEDARLIDAGRRRLSDEEYVAAARPMPDEKYLAQMQRLYGLTWS